MKRFLGVSLLFSLFILTACNSDKKTNKVTEVEKKSTAAFAVSEATNNINWVAYKFTEKTGVKGKFKKVNVISGGEGNSIKEAIHNSEFEIPVSSIFTSDSSRDFKIRKYFFGIMPNPKLLSGKLMIENDSMGYANITMNGITEKLPFKYSIKGKEFSMSTEMNVLEWNAGQSIDSLNAVCEDLHKGLDGVSKLWPQVSINVLSAFK